MRAKKTSNKPEVKTVEIKTKFYKKRRFLFILLCLFILASGAAAFYILRTNKDDNDSELISDSSAGAEVIVEKYGTQYGDTAKELQKTSPADWDKAMLDKAYFNLLYADKIGAFAQVYAMLSSLEAAKRNGTNIDDNKWGVNQEMRDAIKKRADDLAGVE